MKQVLHNISHGVRGNPLTKNGLSSFSEVEDLEDEIHENVFDRLCDLNELILEFTGEDLLQYFYNEYYLKESSFEVISGDIGVPKKTLSNWFRKYFGWIPRDLNQEATTATKKLMSTSLLGNSNGVRGYLPHKRNTAERVQELLRKRSGDWTKEMFPIDDFNKPSQPFYKAKIIFLYFGYSDDFFDTLVIQYQEQNIGITAITTIINTLIESLVMMLDVKVDAPQISKQTISNYIKRNRKI